MTNKQIKLKDIKTEFLQSNFFLGWWFLCQFCVNIQVFRPRRLTLTLGQR